MAMTSYTPARGDIDEIPEDTVTLPNTRQCCPMCKQVLLVTIINSTVILAAIVTAVIYHVLVSSNVTHVRYYPSDRTAELNGQYDSVKMVHETTLPTTDTPSTLAIVTDERGKNAKEESTSTTSGTKAAEISNYYIYIAM